VIVAPARLSTLNTTYSDESPAQTSSLATSPVVLKSMAAIVTSFGRAVVKVTSCCPVSPVRIIATRVPSGDTATLKSDLPLRTNCGGCWRSRGSASVRMFWNVMIPCVLSGLTAPPLGVVDGFPDPPVRRSASSLDSPTRRSCPTGRACSPPLVAMRRGCSVDRARARACR